MGNISNKYNISTEQDIYEATARGKFKQLNMTPIVGDEVEIEITDESKKEAVINSILNRKNYLKRPKIANVSQIAFVISTLNPVPDLLMLDKQLAYAEWLKITPIIVINKIDIDTSYIEIKNIYEQIGYKVICTSVKENLGIEDLKKTLENNLTVFSGNSGVGKSSLLNSIFQKKIVQEGEISKKNKKGKNTTTDVKIYELNFNTFVADTPGFSSFELIEIEARDLSQYFKEFKCEAEKCEYVGCTHIKEENCGVKDSKKISKQRYMNYCKIYQELKDKEFRKYK